MRAPRAVTLTLLGLALLWSAPSIGAPDGWYSWQIEGDTTTLYILKKGDQPTRVRMFDPNCSLSMNGIDGDITDMGSLSREDSVAMLLGIAKTDHLNMDVRGDALFWLAQSNSDSAYEYIAQLLFDN